MSKSSLHTPNLTYSSSTTAGAAKKANGIHFVYASSWETALDLNQYPIQSIYKESGYDFGDYVIEYNPIGNQSITFTDDVTDTDSQRTEVVFDFTEYSATSSGNIIINFTAIQPIPNEYYTWTDKLEIRTTSSVYTEIEPAATSTEYSVTLSSYTMTDGFVSVWFRTSASGPLGPTDATRLANEHTPTIAISNITARISCTGRTQASITPYTTKTAIVTDDISTVIKDTKIDFLNLDLSSWPSTLQEYGIDSIVSYFGTQDNVSTTQYLVSEFINGKYASRYSSVLGKAQATESSDSSPSTTLTLTTATESISDNIDTIIGGGLTGTSSLEPDIYTATDNIPTITYNRLSSTDLSSLIRTDLSDVDLTISYINPALGSYENTFLKTKVLIQIQTIAGPVTLANAFGLQITPELYIRPTISLATTNSITAASNLELDISLEDLDTIFELDPIGGLRLEASPTVATSFELEIIEGLYINSGTFSLANSFTTAISPQLTIANSKTLDTVASISISPYLTIANSKTLTNIFTVQVDGDVDISAGLVNLITNNTLTTTAKLFKKDPSLPTINNVMDLDTTTGSIHIFTYGTTSLASAFSITATAKLFKKDPNLPTISNTMTFDTTTGSIHIFTFGTVALPNSFSSDFVGGFRKEGSLTSSISFTTTSTGVVYKLGESNITTSFSISTPSINIILKKANVIKLNTMTRVYLVNTQVRTIQAELVSSSSTDTVVDWGNVTRWIDFITYTTKTIDTQYTVNTQVRTLSLATNTRTWLVPLIDNTEEHDIQTTTYMVNAQVRTLIVSSQSRINQVIAYNRTITLDTNTRILLEERL